MDRKKIIINDSDSTDVADLRKSLVTVGYDVRLVASSTEALNLLDTFHPNLIICETRMPEMDGPHLLQEIRKRPALQRLPFVLTGKLKNIDQRIAVMKLPLDDYWQKPIEAEEAVVRVEMLIKDAELLSASLRPKWRGFNGNLVEMSLADLLQTIEVGKKTCVIKLYSQGREGTVFVTDGEVIDAELDQLEARRALLRMFTWTEGNFQVELRPHERARLLTMPTRDLISEGLTRHERWTRLLSQMPPLPSPVTRAPEAVAGEWTEEEKALMALLDGAPVKSISALVEESPSDDLRTLTVLKRLMEKGAIITSSLPVERKNGDFFARLQEVRQQGADETKKIDAFVDLMVTASNAPAPRPVERRRTERRQLDRRQTERRRSSVMHEKIKMYLNKSELLMIREKLARL
jgi:DNA-binding response OmpR family regulator